MTHHVRSVAKTLVVALVLLQGAAASAASEGQNLRGIGGGSPRDGDVAVAAPAPLGNSTDQQTEQFPVGEATAGNPTQGIEQGMPAALSEAPGKTNETELEAEASLFCSCGLRKGAFCCGKTWIECCQIGLLIRKCTQIRYDPRCTYSR
mmetsp:Transcript_96260/g.241291  ORF Transcript_96260/g.241291 Transcript_96260/m.241291 type:complete len:149 (+) Transcript_96260:85-531(+)